MLGSLILAHAALGGYRVTNLVGDAHAGGAGSEHDHAQVAELLLAHVEPRHNCCQGHAACPLDIIVEAGDSRPIRVEDAPR